MIDDGPSNYFNQNVPIEMKHRMPKDLEGITEDIANVEPDYLSIGHLAMLLNFLMKRISLGRFIPRKRMKNYRQEKSDYEIVTGGETSPVSVIVLD
jgi:hypothetical protein